MSFALLDRIADSVNVLFPLLLLAFAIYFERARSWRFILITVVAFLLSQQIAKAIQRSEVLGNDFPSTHFAVCLVFATSLWVLRPKLWPLAVAIPVLYGALMLYVHARFGEYHTPIELLGAFYAVPLSWFLHQLGKRKTPRVETN